LTLDNKKIGFIGAGNMAEALIKGLISSKTISKQNIFASDTNAKRLKYICRTYSVRGLEKNTEAAKSADIIVLAVKPQIMRKVLSSLSPAVKKKHMVISIAAGIKVKSIKKLLSKGKVIRVMPNNPALVGEGITAISIPKKSEVSDSDLKVVQKIFESVGKTVLVQEELMDAVTALSGSGPGFAYFFVEALIDGGVAAGLTYNSAKDLAIQTLLGASKTLIESNKKPESLRAMVTSPGGTTQAGLRVLESKDFKKVISQAIVSASRRAKELSEGLS